MKLLEGKIAIVTGAAHPMGMGFAACRKLAEAGAKVIVTDLVRNDEELSNLNARATSICESGGEAVAFPVDVTDRAQIDACVEMAKNTFGTIDILFNNAGTPIGFGEFLNVKAEAWDISFQVNLKGVASFCQAVIPVMIEAGGGTIINNSSVSGIAATEKMSPYTATKFGVVGLTKALASEFGRERIRVNTVCPGTIWTQLGQLEAELWQEELGGVSLEESKKHMAQEIPLGRCGMPDEVADVVVYLASEMSSFVSGVAIPVAGGMAPGL